MFEQLRRSLNELLERATKPEDRRAVIARMKSTMVQVKLGVDDLRDALVQSRRKLESEQRELSTVRRRKELALGIQDAETVAVAERFERQHEERARVLEEMKVELRKAMTGVPSTAGAESLDDPLAEPGENPRVREEIDALARERARADRDADAARRLEELKKKMGK